MDKRRGFTFLEALAASLILLIGVAGMFGIWNLAITQIQRSSEVNLAGELARADIETAKVQGYLNHPLGTYTGIAVYPPDTTASPVGTYTGAISYYNESGTKQNITSPNAATRYSLQRIVKDHRVQPAASGSGYSLADTSVRVVKVEVRQYPGNTSLVTMGHILVKGGV